VGHVDVDHLAIVVLGRINELARHALLAQDPLAMVDIVNEGIDGTHALLDAALDTRPFFGREDARNDVEREHALRALGIRVHGERNAALQEGRIHVLDARENLFTTEPREGFRERLVMRTRLAVGEIQLVVMVSHRVLWLEIQHGRRVSASRHDLSLARWIARTRRRVAALRSTALL
jgi:hypothetical protein